MPPFSKWSIYFPVKNPYDFLPFFGLKNSRDRSIHFEARSPVLKSAHKMFCGLLI